MPSSLKRITRLALTVFFLAIALAGCNSLPAKPESISRGDYDSTKRYIAELIQHEMKKHQVTGLSIALVDDQKIIWAQGFGYADKENNIPATAETVYRAGSISKLFTDTAVMQLAEQGKLDIDRPLQTYLPELSIKSRFASAGPITPRNVMTHHSGLPDSLLNGMWGEHPDSFTKVAGSLKDDYVAYPPNFIFSYSNVGITLLGHAIQKVTGENFSDRLDRTVLRPLGMEHSAFSTGPQGPLMAKGYRDGLAAQETPLRDVPAGGLNSNVLDLSRFMQMVFADGQSNGHAILQPATLAEMLRPQNDAVPLDRDFRIGLGWMFNKRIKNGGPVVGHNGATMLHRASMSLIPDHKLGVVVLSNSSSAVDAVNEIATQALKLALEVKTGRQQPKAPEAEVVTTAFSEQERRNFEGQYASAFGYTNITNDGNALHADVFGKHLELVPAGDGNAGFLYKLFGFIPIHPEQLKDVKISRAIVAGRDVLLGHVQGQSFIVGEKIVPRPLSQKWLDRVGEYEIVNAPADPDKQEKISVQNRDGVLVIEISMPALGNGIFTRAVAPLSDTEAVILGLGRGLGETIRVVTVDGQEQAAYSGYLLQKKSKQETK